MQPAYRNGCYDSKIASHQHYIVSHTFQFYSVWLYLDFLYSFSSECSFVNQAIHSIDCCSFSLSLPHTHNCLSVARKHSIADILLIWLNTKRHQINLVFAQLNRKIKTNLIMISNKRNHLQCAQVRISLPLPIAFFGNVCMEENGIKLCWD